MLPYAVPYHTPIMVEPVLTWLDVSPGGRYLDATLGGAGHSHAILDASGPDGFLYATDRDPDALAHARERLQPFDGRFSLFASNYSRLPELFAEYGLDPVDGLLLDAGVSSHQLDDPARGFSYRAPGPLDMRMGPDTMSLSEYLDGSDVASLTADIRDFGEIKHGIAGKLARAILEDHQAGKVDNTSELRDLVDRVFPRGRARKGGAHPATLVFQALRIAVNAELEHLTRTMRTLPEVIRPGGRAVFLTFHSLEDRIVKRALRDLAIDCTCPPGLPVCACDTRAKVRPLHRKTITAGLEEVEANPRARSARLRAVEILGA